MIKRKARIIRARAQSDNHKDIKAKTCQEIAESL